MLATIIIVILLIIAALVLAVGISTKRSVRKNSSIRPEAFENYLPPAVALVPLVLALIIGFFACTVFVGAKEVAVVTQFGRPVTTHQSGLAWKAPWQSATTIDGTIQTDEYNGKDAIYVRIGDGSESHLTATIRWRVNPEQAGTVYADYRSNDPTENLRDAVVSTQFKAAAQTVLSKYNPIANLQVVSGHDMGQIANLNFSPDYDAVAQQLTQQMRQRVEGDGLVKIESITVSYLSLADSTQKTLNDFIKAVGETRIAAQGRNTAAEQAQANATISKSVDNNPGVLQSRCIDALNAAIQQKYTLPAGFNCLGNSAAVVVPSK